MKFFPQVYQGVKCYFDGAKFIYKHKLWIYFLAPVALGVGFYFLGVWFQDQSREVTPTGDSMHDLMTSLLEKQMLDWLGYMFTESQKYIAIMILGTVWAILSEKVEEILTGNEYPFVWKYYVADIKRGVRLNVWSMIQEYLIFFVWLIFSLILDFPDWTNIVAALIIGFFFYGHGYMDYILERRRLNLTQSVHFGRKHVGLAFGIGILYSLAFEFIPYGMGLLIAPIAMVGTTLIMSEYVDLNDNRYAKKKEAASAPPTTE